MAQDFFAAFGLGDSDKAIGTIDADGVDLAAIQGLRDAILNEECGLAEVEAANEKLEARIAALEAAMPRLLSLKE